MEHTLTRGGVAYIATLTAEGGDLTEVVTADGAEVHRSSWPAWMQPEDLRAQYMADLLACAADAYESDALSAAST